MRPNLDGRRHPAAAAESSCPNTPAYTHAPGDNDISEEFGENSIFTAARMADRKRRRGSEGGDAANPCIEDADVGDPRRRDGTTRACQRVSEIASPAEATASSTRRSGPGVAPPRTSSAPPQPNACEADCVADTDDEDDLLGPMTEERAKALRKACALLKGHLTSTHEGSAELPTREHGVTALKILQDKVDTMRDLEPQAEALHSLYDESKLDETYGFIADAVIAHLLPRFEPGSKFYLLDMAAGKGRVTHTLTEHNRLLPQPFILQPIKADLIPNRERGVVGVDGQNRPVGEGKPVDGRQDVAIARSSFYTEPVTSLMLDAMFRELKFGGLIMLLFPRHQFHNAAPTLQAALTADVLTSATIAPVAQRAGENPAHLLFTATRGDASVDTIRRGMERVRDLCLGVVGAADEFGQACWNAFLMMRTRIALEDAGGDSRRRHARLSHALGVLAASELFLACYPPFGSVVAHEASSAGEPLVVALLKQSLIEAGTSLAAIVRRVEQRQVDFEGAPPEARAAALDGRTVTVDALKPEGSIKEVSSAMERNLIYALQEPNGELPKVGIGAPSRPWSQCRGNGLLPVCLALFPPELAGEEANGIQDLTRCNLATFAMDGPEELATVLVTGGLPPGQIYGSTSNIIGTSMTGAPAPRTRPRRRALALRTCSYARTRTHTQPKSVQGIRRSRPSARRSRSSSSSQASPRRSERVSRSSSGRCRRSFLPEVKCCLGSAMAGNSASWQPTSRSIVQRRPVVWSLSAVAVPAASGDGLQGPLGQCTRPARSLVYIIYIRT